MEPMAHSHLRSFFSMSHGHVTSPGHSASLVDGDWGHKDHGPGQGLRHWRRKPQRVTKFQELNSLFVLKGHLLFKEPVYMSVFFFFKCVFCQRELASGKHQKNIFNRNPMLGYVACFPLVAGIPSESEEGRGRLRLVARENSRYGSFMKHQLVSPLLSWCAKGRACPTELLCRFSHGSIDKRETLLFVSPFQVVIPLNVVTVAKKTHKSDEQKFRVVPIFESKGISKKRCLGPCHGRFFLLPAVKCSRLKCGRLNFHGVA